MRCLRSARLRDRRLAKTRERYEDGQRHKYYYGKLWYGLWYRYFTSRVLEVQSDRCALAALNFLMTAYVRWIHCASVIRGDMAAITWDADTEALRKPYWLNAPLVWVAASMVYTMYASASGVSRFT